MKVLNFGSLNIDYVYRVNHFVQPKETMSALDLTVGCGGKGLNQSVALGKAGVQVWHAGFIGAEGYFLKEKLDEAGVCTEFVKTVTGATGHAIIQVDETGENCILLHGGANQCFTKEYIDEVLSQFEAGDIVLLQNETNEIAYMIEQAYNRGMRVALNAAPITETVKSLPLEKLSWLLVNEVEGAFLAGTNQEEDILKTLGEKYPNTTIVLTLGGDGVMGLEGSNQVVVPAKKVEVVDSTAAGDTFTGYFLYGMIKNYDLKKSLEVATAASAIAVTRAGAADSVPMQEEVKEIL